VYIWDAPTNKSITWWFDQFKKMEGVEQLKSAGRP
jgi:hypothetical protein